MFTHLSVRTSQPTRCSSVLVLTGCLHPPGPPSSRACLVHHVRLSQSVVLTHPSSRLLVRLFRPPVSCVLNSCLVLICRSPRDAPLRARWVRPSSSARSSPLHVPLSLLQYRCCEDPRVSGQPRRSTTHPRYLSVIHISTKTQGRSSHTSVCFPKTMGHLINPAIIHSSLHIRSKTKSDYHVDYLRHQAGPRNSRSTVSLCSSSRPTGKVHFAIHSRHFSPST
jgi:hypothetical protein